MSDRAGDIAKEIFRQHNAREAYRPLEGDLAPRDVAEAYQAQFRLHEMQSASGRGPLGGRKIALASKVQQELCGVDHPIAGGIFAGEIRQSPAMLDYSEFHGLGVEFELAVKMAETVDIAGPFTPEALREKVESIHPAFEMITDRDADYEKLDGLTMIADNAWSGGIVLGPEIRNWRDLDVNETIGELRVNDDEPVKARLGDADPFGSLAWIGQVLADGGRRLRAGHVVITGSVICTQYPKGSTRMRWRIAGAEAELSLE